MKTKYLIRLDDACPTMDAAKWKRIEDILDDAGVRPMVGVIPNNKDSKQFIDAEDLFFWNKVLKWDSKKWAIALHGYDHVCISNDGLKGLNKVWERSEFAGVSLDVQKDKIRRGVAIFRNHGINPRYFFAPSHTFDENTLKALESESDIRIVCDTIASRPYKMNGFVFIPQMGGHCAEMKIPGIWTFCLHPSTMTEAQFLSVEQFTAKHRSELVGFDELDLTYLGGKSIVSSLISFIYFAKRKLR